MFLKTFGTALVRRKQLHGDCITDTKLVRCLTTLDLTALGVGSTLGAGIYVVAGEVAKKTAGPAVILSFLIAAAASCLAGLCYAEFGARVPKTGSAYVYSYVSVGELMAFVIGWNLMLEYIIGTASVARAWSANFDELINKTIAHFFEDTMPMDIPGIARYPDFFAFGITLLLTVILAIGVKESATFTKIFTGLNLMVVIYVFVCGLFKVDLANWQVDPQQFLENNGTYYTNATIKGIGAGGFFPFGVSGMLSGASTCFYAFVGFDAIATTGEEVKNPQRSIPIGIVSCLIICFVAYSAISAIITLMCPYYAVYTDAPLPAIFDRAGWPVARYIIAVGSICALSTSLLGAMFPLPRVIYAMASDGLLFRFLSAVHQRSKTPLIATILSGLFSGTMACLFELDALVDMMSIGTLLAYTLVAVSVLILRGRRKLFKGSCYDNEISEATTPSSNAMMESSVPLMKKNGSNQPRTAEKLIETKKNEISFKNYTKHFFIPRTSIPSKITEFVSTTNTYLLFISLCITAFLADNINQKMHWITALFIISAIVSLIFCVSLFRMPENQEPITFKVPLTPWIPAISIFVNVYLMIKLSIDTWIRFAVWMAVGFLIYFAYGIWNSSESSIYQRKQLRNTSDDSSLEKMDYEMNNPANGQAERLYEDTEEA